jgi:hypothetical protein
MIARPLRLSPSACCSRFRLAQVAPAPPIFRPLLPPQQTATAPAPPPQEPLTPEKAKADCWMKYEGDKKIKNIDQRLSLVEKCVDDTMRIGSADAGCSDFSLRSVERTLEQLR